MSNNNLFGIYFGYINSKTFDQNNIISTIETKCSINGQIVPIRKLLNDDFSSKDGIIIQNLKDLKNRKFTHKHIGVEHKDKINEFMQKLFESCQNEINIIIISIPVFFQEIQKQIIEDSIKSIKKESKIYFLEEPFAAIISYNILYKQQQKKKIGNFYLIIIFYNDLYEISIALYEKNSNENPYSFKYSIRDFNLQNLIEELQMIKKIEKLEKVNLLENILNDIKNLIEEKQLDIKNLEKILILSENKQIKKYLKKFKNYFQKIKIENTIDFLTIEDSIIDGVRKYARINIQETNYQPIEQKCSPEKKRKKKLKLATNTEENYYISKINQPYKKKLNTQRETNNYYNFENIKTIFNEEKIESNFNKTDYREKKDNKKKKNEIIELHEMIKKSEENNVKFQEMIKKSEENNLQFQKMILESNRKSEENNLKFKEMIKKSEENNLKFQEIQEKVLELHKTIIESNKKSEEKNLKQFKKYDKKISELHDKLNLITNENKDNEKKIKSVSYNSEKKKISLPSLNSNSSNN